MIRPWTGPFLAALVSVIACSTTAAQTGGTKSKNDLKTAVKRYEDRIAKLEDMIRKADDREKTEANEERRRADAARLERVKKDKDRMSASLTDVRRKLDRMTKELLEARTQNSQSPAGSSTRCRACSTRAGKRRKSSACAPRTRRA
jgi:F0F1-type ATP synthase membrane subunit b/b'